MSAPIEIHTNLGSPNEVGCKSDNQSHGEVTESEPFVMVFLFGGLALGLALQAVMNLPWIKRFVQIPYTVALLLIGLGIGLLMQVLIPDPTHSHKAFLRYTMANTDPHLIMYIFLPILIFDSSFKMEAHSVFKAFGQIAILAILGLLITALIIGGCLFAILNVVKDYNEWKFPVCMVIGSILSATDPVAVVSLLRDMGATKQIVILTEGESLFNDGTAIIAYDIFLQFAWRSLNVHKNENLSVILSLQLAGIVIAPLIGFVAGKICEIILRKTFNNEIREKGVILITAYTTFFICEQIHVSGVLALCVQGIWLSYRKHSISPDTTEDNNRFWDFFNYWANTLIFLLSGMVISKPIYENGKSLSDTEDYLIMIGVYFIMNFARAISVLILYPVLVRCGYGLPWKHAFALVWGGLRGAIALLLALRLLEDPVMIKYEKIIGEKAMLYVSGSVALTLLINATTFGSLIRFFRLDAIPEHKLKVVRSAFICLQEVQKSIINQLKDDRFLAEADWDLVVQLSSLRNQYAQEEHKKEQTHLHLQSNQVADLEDVVREEVRLRVLQVRTDLVQYEYRDPTDSAVLKVEKVSYWRQFARGLLSNRSITVLSDAVEHAIETPGAELKVESMKREWRVTPVLTIFQRFLQNAYSMHMRWKTEESEWEPSSHWRKQLYRFMNDYRVNCFILLLILGHVGIVCAELSRAISFGAQNKIRFAFFVIYCLFITETILKLLATGAKYFKQKINIFDFIFTILYIVNLIALFVNLRQSNTTAYYILISVLTLRLLKLFFFLPFILPKILSGINCKIHEQVGLAYDSAKGFIIGEEDTHKQVHRLIDNDKLADEVGTKCKRRRLEAIKHLAELQVKHPGAAISVKTKQAAQYCLNTVQDALKEMKESGILDDTEYEIFDKLVEENMLRVKNAPSRVDPLPIEKQLQHFSWINEDQDLIDFILQHGERQNLKSGEVVMTQGSAPDGVYILASGMMKVVVERKGIIVMEEYMFPGRYFGEMGLITGEPRSATITSEGPSVIYFIAAHKMHKAFLKFKNVYWQFIRSYCISKCSDTLQESPAFHGWTDVKLKTHLATGCFINLDPTIGYKRQIEGEILILVRGEAKDAKTNDLYQSTNGCIMLPGHVIYVAHVGNDPTWLYSIPPITANKFAGFLSEGKELAESMLKVLSSPCSRRSSIWSTGMTAVVSASLSGGVKNEEEAWGRRGTVISSSAETIRRTLTPLPYSFKQKAETMVDAFEQTHDSHTANNDTAGMMLKPVAENELNQAETIKDEEFMKETKTDEISHDPIEGDITSPQNVTSTTYESEPSRFSLAKKLAAKMKKF